MKRFFLLLLSLLLFVSCGPDISIISDQYWVQFLSSQNNIDKYADIEVITIENEIPQLLDLYDFNSKKIVLLSPLFENQANNISAEFPQLQFILFNPLNNDIMQNSIMIKKDRLHEWQIIIDMINQISAEKGENNLLVLYNKDSEQREVERERFFKYLNSAKWSFNWDWRDLNNSENIQEFQNLMASIDFNQYDIVILFMHSKNHAVLDLLSSKNIDIVIENPSFYANSDLNFLFSIEENLSKTLQVLRDEEFMPGTYKMQYLILENGKKLE